MLSNQWQTNQPQRNKNTAGIGHGGINAPWTICSKCCKTWAPSGADQLVAPLRCCWPKSLISNIDNFQLFFFVAAAVSHSEYDTLSVRVSYSSRSTQDKYFFSKIRFYLINLPLDRMHFPRTPPQSHLLSFSSSIKPACFWLVVVCWYSLLLWQDPLMDISKSKWWLSI